MAALAPLLAVEPCGGLALDIAFCQHCAMMPPELHRWFVEQATPLSPKLADDLAAVGPIWFPDRPDHGPAGFLARAIVGQQISAAAARGIWARLEGQAAERGLSVADFLDTADEAALRLCGLSRNKMKAILQIGIAARAGTFAELRGIDHLARSEKLCAIWGIGQWTADMMALFYYREPDIWPEGDLAVQRVFKSYIGRRKPARAALRFAPHRSLLALYMWRLVNGLWQ
jgi:DNA-3-methyladenine glycosylase II